MIFFLFADSGLVARDAAICSLSSHVQRKSALISLLILFFHFTTHHAHIINTLQLRDLSPIRLWSELVSKCDDSAGWHRYSANRRLYLPPVYFWSFSDTGDHLVTCWLMTGKQPCTWVAEIQVYLISEAFRELQRQLARAGLGSYCIGAWICSTQLEIPEWPVWEHTCRLFCLTVNF